MNTIEFAEMLIKNGLAERQGFQGCSEEEIQKLEKFFKAKLPREYRNFLALMGHSAGNYHVGTTYLYKDLFGLTELARETLEEGPFKLPSDAFVFSSHQGYIFTYFNLLDGENPPIYTYMEGESHPLKWAKDFSEYLKKSLAEEVDALGQLAIWENRAKETKARKDKQ